MGTTDFETIRTTQINTVSGLTPTAFIGTKFRVHRSENDFRDWSVENKQAAFRRFSILDLFDYDPVDITNKDVEFTQGREEVVVAYPQDFRYGGDNQRDLHDLARKDFYLIEKNLGQISTVYTDAHAVLQSMDFEELEGVTFLNIVYTFRFYRSV